MAVCELPVDIQGCPHPPIVAQYRSKCSQYVVGLLHRPIIFMDTHTLLTNISYIYSLHDNRHTCAHTLQLLIIRYAIVFVKQH